jgi:hypothetical protein
VYKGVIKEEEDGLKKPFNLKKGACYWIIG